MPSHSALHEPAGPLVTPASCAPAGSVAAAGHGVLASPLGRLLLMCAAFGAMAVHMHTRLYMENLAGRDYEHYVTMESTRALTPVPAPFAYRWIPHKLIPFIPLPAKRVHEIVNVAALCGTGWILVEWLVRLGYSARLVVPAVILGFTWSMFGSVYFLWARFATEPVTYLLLAAGVYLAHFGALWQLAGVIVLGMLSREQAILLVPYYFLVRRGPLDLRRCTGQTLFLGALALATFVLVRVVTPTSGRYTYGEEIVDNLTMKFGSLSGFATHALSLVLHAGLVSLVPVLMAWTSLAILRKSPAIALWLLGCMGLAVIGGAETDRIAFAAFPAVLFVFCALLDRIGFGWTLEWMPAVLVFVLGQIVISGTFADGAFHWPRYTPLWSAVSGVIWGTALWLCSRRPMRAAVKHGSIQV